jgi:hydroxyacylglutathione hydrolase
MFFYRRTIPGLAIHSYLVGDEKTKQCAVIDPVRDVEEYIQIAQENEMQISHILETHVHADFVSGAKELKKKLDGKAVIHCSGMGGEAWIPEYADRIVKDGDTVDLGSLSLQAVHTPGHTPEHLMWAVLENGKVTKLLTGDLLFVGAVGRPDLLGEEEMAKLAHQLYDTVFEKLDSYSDDVEVRPAHGAGSLCGKSLGSNPYSTMGVERAHNEYLIKTPEDKWVASLMDEMPPVPNYFPRMKKINVSGANLIEKTLGSLESLSPEAVQKKVSEGALLIDLRSKEAFAAAHIPLAINIPFSPQISTWAGWLLSEKDPIILVLDDPAHLHESVIALLRVGFDRIEGFLAGCIWAWEDAGFETSQLNAVSAEELQRSLNESAPPFVLDVRTKDEWDRGHISSAHHLHAGLLPEHSDQLPKDRSIAVICGSGFRASIAASYLMKKGFHSVSNVFGGMTSWNQHGFPVK